MYCMPCIMLSVRRRYGLRWRPALYKIDGLNSLQYELVSYDELQQYTHLKVNVLEAKAFPTATFNRVSKASKVIDPRKCRINDRLTSLAMVKSQQRRH